MAAPKLQAFAKMKTSAGRWGRTFIILAEKIGEELNMSGNIGIGVSKRFRYTELLGNTAFVLGILAAGALPFRPAYAQGQTQDESAVSDRAFAIEEITVTAQKRDESLQDVDCPR